MVDPFGLPPKFAWDCVLIELSIKLDCCSTIIIGLGKDAASDEPTKIKMEDDATGIQMADSALAVGTATRGSISNSVLITVAGMAIGGSIF